MRLTPANTTALSPGRLLGSGEREHGGDEAEEGDEVAGDPLLAFAFSWKAAAVWSPERGGFTARTMPDLQSEFAAEKNQSGLVSLTFPCHARSSAVVELGYNEAVTHSKIIGVPGVAID